MIYSVSYDLNRPGQDYEKLFDTLRSFESWCHPLDSTWFVRSNLNVVEVYNQIAAAMDESDKLVVAQAGAPAAWDVASSEVSAWLKENLKFALTLA